MSGSDAAVHEAWATRFDWPIVLTGLYECPTCFAVVRPNRIRHHHVWHVEQAHGWKHEVFHPDCPKCPGFVDPR